MKFKIYCNQFQEYFSFDINPELALRSYVDQINQYFKCNDATVSIIVLNGIKVDSEQTLKQLDIGQDCILNLFFEYFENVTFCLKEDIKQSKKINLNIYQSISIVEQQLAKQLRIDYDVEIVYLDLKQHKTKSLCLLGLNRSHQYSIIANLLIEFNNQQTLFKFSAFEKIYGIKQRIRQQFYITGRFKILYNNGIQLDTNENLNETIYSLQIQNKETFRINTQQHITLKCNLTDHNNLYKVDYNQDLKNFIDQIKQDHQIDNNYLYETKLNGQLIPIETLSKQKEYIMEDIIYLEQEKNELIFITLIEYSNLTNRIVRSFRANDQLVELKNAVNLIGNFKNYQLLNNGINLEIKSITFEEAGFSANEEYFIYYKLVDWDSSNQILSLKEKLNQKQVKKEHLGIEKDLSNKEGNQKKIVYFSEFLSRNTQKFDVNQNDSVKNLLQTREQISQDNYKLYLGSKVLDTNKTYQELQIKNNDIIEITPIKMPIYYNSVNFSEKQIPQDQVFGSQKVVSIQELMIFFYIDQQGELQEKVLEDQIVSQTSIYKQLSQKTKFNMKYQGNIIDVNKSFKQLGIPSGSQIEILQQFVGQQEFNQDDEISKGISEINQQNTNQTIQIQFIQDGAPTIIQKIFNKETIKLSLIKKSILAEYELPDSLEMTYQGKKVNLNSNLSETINNDDYVFILEQQKPLTLQIVFADGDESWDIQIDQDDEISIIYNKVNYKMKYKNFILFYDGKFIQNNSKLFREIYTKGEQSLEVILQ